DTIRKEAREGARASLGPLVISPLERAGERAFTCSGETDQTGSMAFELLPGDLATALGCLGVTGREQAAEVPVSGSRFDQEENPALSQSHVGHQQSHIGSHQRAETETACALPGTRRHVAPTHT